MRETTVRSGPGDWTRWCFRRGGGVRWACSYRSSSHFCFLSILLKHDGQMAQRLITHIEMIVCQQTEGHSCMKPPGKFRPLRHASTPPSAAACCSRWCLLTSPHLTFLFPLDNHGRPGFYGQLPLHSTRTGTKQKAALDYSPRGDVQSVCRAAWGTASQQPQWCHRHCTHWYRHSLCTASPSQQCWIHRACPAEAHTITR